MDELSPASPFVERLMEGAAALEIELELETATRLETFQHVLERWASSINLVGDAGWEATVEAHFLDSLALLRLIPEEVWDWADVGSGAGFPGAVLAAARSQWRIRLVEPSAKRAGFLYQVVGAVGSRNGEVVRERSDDLGDGSCPAVMSRAVMPPPEWLTEAARLTKPSGHVVLMTATGPTPEEEALAEKLGLTELKRDSFTLPFSESPRTNILYRRS